MDGCSLASSGGTSPAATGREKRKPCACGQSRARSRSTCAGVSTPSAMSPCRVRAPASRLLRPNRRCRVCPSWRRTTCPVSTHRPDIAAGNSERRTRFPRLSRCTATWSPRRSKRWSTMSGESMSTVSGTSSRSVPGRRALSSIASLILSMNSGRAKHGARDADEQERREVDAVRDREVGRIGAKRDALPETGCQCRSCQQCGEQRRVRKLFRPHNASSATPAATVAATNTVAAIGCDRVSSAYCACSLVRCPMPV